MWCIVPRLSSDLESFRAKLFDAEGRSCGEVHIDEGTVDISLEALLSSEQCGIADGFAIQFDPELRFEHACSTFDSDTQRTFSPLWKAYYAYRNGLIMYHSAAGLMFWPLLLLVLPKWVLASRRYGEQRSIYLRLLRLAVWHGIRGHTDTEHHQILALAREDDKPTNWAPILDSNYSKLSYDGALATTRQSPK